MEERDPLLSEAYQAADHPEPPPALDARILAAARAAVARPARRRPAWLAWAVPLSTTAVLVLGISLLFKMQREAPETLRDAVAPPPAARNEAAPSAAPATESEPAAKPAGADKAAVTAAVRPPRPKREPATAEPARPAPEAPAVDAAPARESAESAAAAPAGAAPGPVLSPSPAQPARAPRSAPTPANAAADLFEQKGQAAAPNRQFAPAFSQSLGKLKGASPATESPEQWVESLRRLVRAGRIEEARKSLEELRERHPDFAVPEDLQALLGAARAR